MSRQMYHPCHKLSVPSAKIFWCRHCMQMFEDAISRWRHSKICRGSAGIKKEKGRDGRVIQMYVKPDKVSYTSNLTPGLQVINHKKQVKTTGAELRCIICLAKFSCLHDMREHVKSPCTKNNPSSDFSCNSNSNEEAAVLEIRRVEEPDRGPISTTSLSVLAEASKHVESLANPVFVHQEINPVPQFLIQNQAKRQTVTVKPAYPEVNYSGVLASEVEVEAQQVVPQSIPGSVQPVNSVPQSEDNNIILIQREDGSEDIDLAALQVCLQETAHNSPPGQVIEVRLGPNHTYRYMTQASENLKTEPVDLLQEHNVGGGDQLYTPSYYIELLRQEHLKQQAFTVDEKVCVQNS